MEQEATQLQPQEVQQPGQADTPAVVSNEPAQQYLTKEAAESLIKDLTAKQFQAIQSMQAKQGERIKKEFDQRLAALQAAGLQVTPEQAQVIQQQTRQQFEQLESANEPAAQPGQQQPDLDPINSAAIQMMDNAGVRIEDNDPELSLIDRTTDKPGIYLASVYEAIAKKKERMSRPGGSPASIPTVAGRGSPSDLRTEFEAKKKKIARGDILSLTNLQTEYRVMGLDI